MRLRTSAALALLGALASGAASGRAPGLLDARLDALDARAKAEGLDATRYAPSPYLRPEDLPATIEIETSYQGWNDYDYFALVDGRVWHKPRLKRPAGAPEWVNDLPWRPFGHGEGLPYRLDARDPEALDTTWADTGRRAFVEELTFLEAEGDWRAHLDPEEQARVGTWPHDEPLAFHPEFPSPARVLALTADEDELAVLTDTRQMFYRRRFANLFVSSQWNAGWGQSKDLPVFFPKHLTGHRGWSLGRITAFGTGYKTGPDGRHYEWGPAAVSMETMVWLHADGHRIFYLDSGTPPEVNHYVEAPFRGRYLGEAINAAASTIMLIDRYGAIQTRIADFDLQGSTPTHPYCYNTECDDEPFYPPGDIRSGMSDIRLPPEPWRVHAPVLPPESWSADTRLSKRISIHATGKGNAARELRVAGLLGGVAGTFYKAIDGAEWRFRAAPPGDRGFWELEADLLDPLDLSRYYGEEILEILHQDQPDPDAVRAGRISLGSGANLEFRVLDYNPRASPWHVEIGWGGKTLPMELHVVQAWNPYLIPQPAAEDSAQLIHTWEGTLAFDRVELERRIAGETATSEGDAVRRLLDQARDLPFVLLVNASDQGVEITTKSERRTGPLHAVAFAPELGAEPASARMEDWSAAFWGLQRGHMGWEARARALVEAGAPVDCSAAGLDQAARLVHLDAQMREDVEGISAVRREARRFSVFTLATSGFLYLTQAKTIEALLGAERRRRDAAVRPNELRFVIILGVTRRIPYLAANISRVQARRLAAARDEQHAARALLGEALGQAQRLDCVESGG